MPTLPSYSELQDPAPTWPSNRLAACESEEAFEVRCDQLRQVQLAPGRRPRQDAALLTILLSRSDMIAMKLPDLDGGCWPAFTSTLRAEDYVRAFRLEAPELQLLSISAEETIRLASELVNGSLRWALLDPCPRCAELHVVGTQTLTRAEDIVDLWAVTTARRKARLDLHVAQALALARDGSHDEARRVALGAANHITLEDARLHLMLGELATALGDADLRDEARSFLDYLNDKPRLIRLGRSERTGKADFSDL